MAAELPYATAPTHKPAAAAAAAATTTGRVSRATVGILVFLALNLVLSVRRVWDDGAALACVVATYLNMALIFYTLRCSEVAPEGSPASGRARLAGWVLTATQTAAFAWKIGEVFPLGIAVAAWVLAAATVGWGYYFMFLHDDDEMPI